MFKKCLQATLLLLATAMSMNVSAAVIDSGTESGSVTITGTSTSTNIWELFHSLVIPQFNEENGLRTLTSIDLTFTGSTAGMITFTNNGATSASYTAQVQAFIGLSGSETPGMEASLFTLSAGGTGPFAQQYLSGSLSAEGGTSSATVPATDLTTSGSNSIALGSLGGLSLEDFIGTGNVTTYLSSQVTIASSSTGDFTISGAFSTDGTLDYVYNYNVNSALTVSEPSSIALLGVALALLGFSMRRRKAN